MKKTITYSGEIELEIPDDKIEEILKSFKETIDSSADVDDLFTHLAHNIIYCGCDGFVEGIGEDYEVLDMDKPDLEII